MPNKARYLSPDDVIDIINLRGKKTPCEIAEQFKIGLTRLYKIWTDASQDKKFPGGLAGTVAGKHLSDQINNLDKEIIILRDEYFKKREERDQFAARVKKMEKNVECATEILTELAGKINMCKSAKPQGDKILQQYIDNNKQIEEYEVEIKRLQPQLEEKKKIIDELKKSIEENTITEQQLRQQNDDLKKTIDKHEKAQKDLVDILKNSKDLIPRKKTYDDNFFDG